MDHSDAHPDFNGDTAHDRKIDAPFEVSWIHRLRMTRDVFDVSNPILKETLGAPEGDPHRVIAVVDDGVDRAWPGLGVQIRRYADEHADVMRLIGEPILVPGGEACKNDWTVFHRIVRAIEDAGICRRSYVIVIGGGAVLDAVGFAAATVHRGVRLIRIPSTTLAQADSGIGVKNGINSGGAGGKKNFLGVFSPPWAVINDEALLATLSDRDWRSGLSEAVKVALVKDAAFFSHIEASRSKLNERDEQTALPIIRHAAELHLRHIVSEGDPFELTAARPLDFGHWAAHKLESMTDYQLTHGEAVAIGMALDVTYSRLIGGLPTRDAERILDCLRGLGFALYEPVMADTERLFEGIEEFREHLGGRLTIPLLEGIGAQRDVHEIDLTVMRQAVDCIRASAIPTASA